MCAFTAPLQRLVADADVFGMLQLGGSLRTSTTLVSTDGSHILVACGPNVRVHSAMTGHRLLTLEGHAADVTAICAHPKNESLVRYLVTAAVVLI